MAIAFTSEVNKVLYLFERYRCKNFDLHKHGVGTFEFSQPTVTREIGIFLRENELHEQLVETYQLLT